MSAIQVIQRLLQLLAASFRGLQSGINLGGDEDLVAWDTRLAHGLTDLLFIAVELSRVDASPTRLECLFDDVYCGVTLELIDAKSYLRNCVACPGERDALRARPRQTSPGQSGLPVFKRKVGVLIAARRNIGCHGSEISKICLSHG